MSREIVEIEKKIHRSIQEFSMLEPGGTIIVGFSGGADSMALLHFLSRGSHPVLAAHVNHQLRGEESQRDENAAAVFCGELGIPIQIHREDVAARAKQNRESVEECGRAVRYEFFHSLLQTESDRIATAHTLSDQVETVLLHLAQGAGSRGLQGIPPVRGSVIRPLLEITRQEVEAYCAYYTLPYVDDSTNFSRQYTRNRIRLDVIPVLRGINSSLEEAVLRTTHQLREEESYLCDQATQALRQAAMPGGYRTDLLAGLPQPLLSRAVIQVVRDAEQSNGSPPVRFSAGRIQDLCEAVRGQQGGVSIGHGLEFRVEQKILFCRMGNFTKNFWQTPLEIPQDFFAFHKHVKIQLQNDVNFKNMNKFHILLFNNAIDYDTIASNATWRNRRDGDSFAPQGRGLTKTLKKLFNEANIPASRRDEILMLEAGGEIVWIEGFGPAQGYGVGSGTQRVAWILIEENAQ